MSDRRIAPIALVAALGLVAADGARGASRAETPSTPRIRVLDLLDDEIALDSRGETPQWESEPFATAAFSRIGLRAAGEATLPDSVGCQTVWDVTGTGAFEDPGLPVARASRPDVLFTVPYFLPASFDFGEVRGLRAKVICLAGQGGHQPGGPAQGLLTDVKVLLRRD